MTRWRRACGTGTSWGFSRVGTTIALGTDLLPRVLVRFQQSHPNLQIRSVVSNGAALQQALLNNELDFAVMEGSVGQEELARRAIAPDPGWCSSCPPDDPRAHQERLELKDLAQDPLLLRDKGSVGRAFVERVFAMHELPLVPAMESVSTQAIIQAVHLGLGISFLPERLVSGAVQSGLVATKELCDESFERENYIVWHRHKFLTSSAQELMDCFDQMSGELPIATGPTTSSWKPPTPTIAPPLSAARPENNIYR